jgi:hypothetical protein
VREGEGIAGAVRRCLRRPRGGGGPQSACAAARAPGPSWRAAPRARTRLNAESTYSVEGCTRCRNQMPSGSTTNGSWCGGDCDCGSL